MARLESGKSNRQEMINARDEMIQKQKGLDDDAGGMNQ